MAANMLQHERNQFLMIDVTSIDARPGEAEIVSLMADYMAARLFTPRQRKSLSVLIDLTSQPVRVPVTRAMLGPQKSGLGTRPPKQFELTVSTAAGIRDAAEVVAHELLHISQAVNGRLLITAKKRKINGVKRVVDTARWMGGKPVTIDELAWQYRPWEIEACHWQSLLVTEFLMLTTGQFVDQPVQAPKKKQLALYLVKVPAPVMAPRSQGPAFVPAPVMAAPADSEQPAEQATVSVIGSNDASIDAVIANAMPEAEMTPDMMPAEARDGVSAEASAKASGGMQEEAREDFDTDPSVVPPPVMMPPVMPIEEPDEALMADLAADLALEPQAGGTFGGSFGEPAGDVAGDVAETPAGTGSAAEADQPSIDLPESANAGPEGALQDLPVYDKAAAADADYDGTAIEVDVPGLDSPRTLDPVAMSRKLDELRDRGLVGA